MSRSSVRFGSLAPLQSPVNTQKSLSARRGQQEFSPVDRSSLHLAAGADWVGTNGLHFRDARTYLEVNPAIDFTATTVDLYAVHDPEAGWTVDEYLFYSKPVGFEKFFYDIFRYWREEVWEKRLEKDIQFLTDRGRVFSFTRGLLWNLDKYYKPSDFTTARKFIEAAAKREGFSPSQKALVDLQLSADIPVVKKEEDVAEGKFALYVGRVPHDQSPHIVDFMQQEEGSWIFPNKGKLKTGYFYCPEDKAVRNAVHDFVEFELGARWPWGGEIAMKKQPDLRRDYVARKLTSE